MENLRVIKSFFILAVGILFFVSSVSFFAFAYDDKTAHPALTDEIVDHFNRIYPERALSNEQKEIVKTGSVEEDEETRWLQHFYDPVNNRGLVFGPKQWDNSKDWAQDTLAQATEDGAWKDTTYGSIFSLFSAKSDFSWERAIYEYAWDDKKHAFLALGHILHLLEDASVPDHTRNDPHPHLLEWFASSNGSPYEIWTKKFTPDNLTLSTKESPVVLGNLNAYFDSMARYSNGNFFSKDTIGDYDKYVMPRIKDISTEIIDGKKILFAYWDDGHSSYRLVKLELKNGSRNEFVPQFDDNVLVMKDYWARLSKQSVLHGAGVVKLFFDEAEKEKETKALYNKNRSWWRKITDKVVKITESLASKAPFLANSDFFSGEFKRDDGFQFAGQVSLNGDQPQQSSTPESQTSDSNKIDSDPNKQLAANIQPTNALQEIQEGKEEDTTYQQAAQTATDNQTQVQQFQQQAQPVEQQTASKECSFNTAQSPTRQTIIINEIAWMGGASDFGLSAADEWFELKNVSGGEVNLNGWQILDKSEKIKIVFDGNARIPANGFYLLERTDDDSAPAVSADLIYTGALNNSDESLRLFNDQCNLIDEALTATDSAASWPAGDNDQKRTMERSPDLSWHTYNGAAQNGIFGTPKQENSAPTIIVFDAGNGGRPANNPQLAAEEPASSPPKILISEVQITGGAGNTENDFIELYNPNGSQVNLNGYRLVKRTQSGASDTSIKSWTSDVYISANGYYLWANSGYTSISTAPDATTAAAVSNDNGVALRFGAMDTGTIIDSVAWGGAQNAFVENTAFSTNPGANQSIQRKFQNSAHVDTNNNSQDFETQTCPSPKAQSRTCPSPNQSPTASFTYSPQTDIWAYNPVLFNAASSTDPDGQIASYQWNFGDGTTATGSTATTSHTYAAGGNFQINLTVVDNQSASSTPASATISVSVPELI